MTKLKALVTGGSGFIGSHLCQCLHENGIDYYNFDIKNGDSHDLLNEQKLAQVIESYRPNTIFHVAALTPATHDDTHEVMNKNVETTQALLRVLDSSSANSKVVFLSTQLVSEQEDGSVEEDSKLSPYALSKKRCESLFLGGTATDNWLIVRPTNVWGPGHPSFPNALWRYIAKGWYLHPKVEAVRSYGYVKNVVYQIVKLSELEEANQTVLYVGDPPIESGIWVDEFAIALSGKPARRISPNILVLLGVIGSAIKLCWPRMPIYLARANRMISHYRTPMARTFELVGPAKTTLPQGVKETVQWLKEQ